MEELWGRKVLLDEIHSTAIHEQEVQLLPTMQELPHEICCLRCGQTHLKRTVCLPDNSYFCPACIQLSRVTSQQHFYHVPEPLPAKRPVFFGWKGTLTKGQQTVSDELLASVKKFESRMIWAVTGAGKTEMLFRSIHYSLEAGLRIAIASPRVDVCLELFPRIQAVFPKESSILLHGKMEESYRYTKLVVCTTHQLLRFYHAFDVLIIDEVDAFPFVNNAILDYGAKQAVKPQSSLIYLTATPTKELLSLTKQNQLQTSILPARYHRRQLPVPKTKWCFNWRQKVLKGGCPRQLLCLIQNLIKTNDVLIFCPSIQLMERLEEILRKKFPEVSLAGVHSQDPARLEKVMAMRNKAYRILLTSTILERGVTFDGVSVLVFGANHNVFATAALVQIAGRVDRRKSYTAGEVWFLHDGLTTAIKSAISQIKKMNALGKERGLLDEV
ncbi:DNA/RNA helicase [Erwinia sp. CPCC 100877]|nr:DNA/RNA helicase [Erwinia sp. CPCC 100877]